METLNESHCDYFAFTIKKKTVIDVDLKIFTRSTRFSFDQSENSRETRSDLDTC